MKLENRDYGTIENRTTDTCCISRIWRIFFQILKGSLSAVSKPIFEGKYSAFFKLYKICAFFHSGLQLLYRVQRLHSFFVGISGRSFQAFLSGTFAPLYAKQIVNVRFKNNRTWFGNTNATLATIFQNLTSFENSARIVAKR